MPINVKKLKKQIVNRDDEINIGDSIIPMDMRFVPQYRRQDLIRHKPYRITKIYRYSDTRPFYGKISAIEIEVENNLSMKMAVPFNGFVLYKTEDDLFIKSLFGG